MLQLYQLAEGKRKINEWHIRTHIHIHACKTSLQRYRNFFGEKLSDIRVVCIQTHTSIIQAYAVPAPPSSSSSSSPKSDIIYICEPIRKIYVCSVVNLVHEWNMFVNASTRTDKRTHAQTLKLKFIHSHVTDRHTYTAICNDHCITSIDKIHINRCIYCVSFALAAAALSLLPGVVVRFFPLFRVSSLSHAYLFQKYIQVSLLYMVKM